VKDIKLEDFVADLKTQSAVVKELIVIGEAARNLTREFKRRYPNVAWDELVEMRNALTYEYFRLRPEDIWKIVTEDMPRLRRQVEEILGRE
jgi:uncharacterized protein with HEPN domain